VTNNLFIMQPSLGGCIKLYISLSAIAKCLVLCVKTWGSQI